MVEDERWFISTGDMATLFGVTRKTISLWESNGCPKRGRGKWFLPDVLKWFLASRDNSQNDTPDEASMKTRKLKADTLYREERARRERILREALEELYFLRTDVEKAWSNRALEAKSAFLLLEKTLPMELAGKDENEMESIIASRVREVLADHARGGKYTPNPVEVPAGSPSVAPAGKNAGKRMGRPKSNPRPKNIRNARQVED
jgi:hypothetical protein